VTRELEDTRTFLRASIEEHEAVKEELKSTHEEVLSANEEFQSTNEELETAKEELQSINEELATTNDELRSRNRELSNSNEALTDARDYADLIIETVRDPLLVLDRDLRVMRANHAFYDGFKTTIEQTEAHRIYDIDAGVWDIPALREELNAILPAGEVFRDFTVTHMFPRVGQRSLLLNARRLPANRQRPEMILLAMEDVTDRQAAAEALRRSESRFRALADADVIGIVLQSEEQGRIIEANDAFLCMLGYTREDLRNGLLRWDDITPPEYRQRDLEGIAEANRRGACTPYEKECMRKDGRRARRRAAASS
jgi:PAS domain S-box-containing protein